MGELAQTITRDGARLPGDRRLAARERARAHGLTIPAALHREILELSRAPT
jgi:(2R)-3-sulfolactate dehydrogenase (NADP+)